MKIQMIALQSLTASQSPTGKQILRGAEYEADATTAREHERQGRGERVKAPRAAAPMSKKA